MEPYVRTLKVNYIDMDRRTRTKATLARQQIWRRLDAYFEVLMAYIRTDRDRFYKELARDQKLNELFGLSGTSEKDG